MSIDQARLATIRSDRFWITRVDYPGTRTEQAEPMIGLLFGFLAVALLILANGYFVSAEFAFVAARRQRLEERAQAGDGRAHAALAVQRRLSFMLSGAQLGITATSVVLGAVAEPTIARAIRPLLGWIGMNELSARGVSIALALLLAAATQMVFGELGPKNLAIATPERLALALARSTRLFLRVCGPLIALFDNLANWLLDLVGIEPVQELDYAVTAEELEVIIQESGRVGSLTPAQTRLLQRVLNSRSLRASDLMVPRPSVVTVAADATCSDLARLALESGHSRFPVVEADLDDVRGVVVAKDVLGVPPDRRAREPVLGLRTPPLAVPESALLFPLLSDLRDAHSQLALVVDEYGGVTGILTLEDIVEELVGEIRDEYDRIEPAVRALGDGSFLVPGSWRLDECERDTGIQLPHGDYDTLSGLIMAELGRVPAVGDTVDTDHARLRVDSLTGFAVEHVRVEPHRGVHAGDARTGTGGDDS